MTEGKPLGSADRPLRVAVIGSGPAGFYAAGHLLSANGLAVEVDMIERLPTPYGLVRGGVAPDHPKIKSVTRVFERIASKPAFHFLGSVEVGKQVSHEELQRWYHVVVYAVGAAGARSSKVPGEDLPGSWSATELVGWYNGHPDFRDLNFDLSGRRAVIVGNGNVAVDVARMLTLSADDLRRTDVADHAMEALMASSVEEVVVLGRRGPWQAAFTHPELRELGELSEADIVVDPADLHKAEDARDDVPDATARRNVELLHHYASRAPSGKPKRVVLRFLTSPVEILGDDRVEEVRVMRNELRRGPDGRLSAHPTGAEEVLDAGLVFRAVGYTGRAVAGLPFDERAGTIPNDSGRVLMGDEHLPGTYVTGWIKRGPSGVIGTNKKCAVETVECILEDMGEARVPAHDAPSHDEVLAEVTAREPRLVTYAGWEAIDAVERQAGEPHGRPRVKLTRVEELLDAAGSRIGTAS